MSSLHIERLRLSLKIIEGHLTNAYANEYQDGADRLTTVLAVNQGMFILAITSALSTNPTFTHIAEIL